MASPVKPLWAHLLRSYTRINFFVPYSDQRGFFANDLVAHLVNGAAKKVLPMLLKTKVLLTGSDTTSLFQHPDGEFLKQRWKLTKQQTLQGYLADKLCVAIFGTDHIG